MAACPLLGFHRNGMVQGRRAAALHAAEAIAAQAAGEEHEEGQHAMAAHDAPATTVWPQGSFDPASLSPLITKGRRTVRRRNADLLAGRPCSA